MIVTVLETIVFDNNFMDKDERRRKAFLVALWSVKGIGLKSFFRVIKTQKKLKVSDIDVWENKSAVWDEMLLSKRQQSSILRFKKEQSFTSFYKSLISSGIQLISFEEESYPSLLKNTDDFPPILFIKVKEKISQKLIDSYFALAISVVGTRKISSYGKLVIRELIPDLINSKFTIISGFMYGVDLQAQRLAIQSGAKTVAVLGFGFNYCYPWSQMDLVDEFLEKGAMFISEFPPETRPKAGNFVRRNRIIAALSLATLLIEAASKSGSHITANFANQYGRLVFAVPGPITNIYSEGTKDLVNKGAILVSNPGDILKEIKEDYHLNFLQESLSKISQKERKILSKRGKLLAIFTNRTIFTFKQLLEASSFDSQLLNQLLFDLEIEGKIENKMGNYCLV